MRTALQVNEDEKTKGDFSYRRATLDDFITAYTKDNFALHELFLDGGMDEEDMKYFSSCFLRPELILAIVLRRVFKV